MNLFDKNMGVFRKRYPHLVSSVENANLDDCQVIMAKNQTPTLKVQFAGKEVFIHSSYDPQKEAQRWTDEMDLKPGDILIVFGFGLGYHIIELLNKAPANARIIVVEPNTAFIKQAFYHLQMVELVSAENLYLVLGEDVPVLKRLFFKFADTYRLDRIKTVSYLPVLRIYADAFQPYQQALYDELLKHYVNISTVLYFSSQWTKNFFSNLKDIILNPGVAALFGKLAGKPAILVSAGPSLIKNMHLLKEAKNKALILCVGSALRVLLKAGIVPDLLISIDGSEANYKHFQGLPEHRIPLVFDPILHHRIVEEHKGPKMVALCNNLVFPWVDYFVREEKGYLKIGASVANIGLDLLTKTGANPIIFVGQDLAFTDGISHASGTSHAVKTLEDLKKGKKFLEIEGIDGGKVVTDWSLYAFLKWFESYIAEHPETTFINATERGAKIPGTQNLTLREALDRYCTKEINIQKMLSGIQNGYKRPSDSKIADIVNKLPEAKEQLIMIKRSAWCGLKKSEELVNLYKRSLPNIKELKKILKSLDKVDREIKEKKQGKQIVLLLFQPFINALRQITDKSIPEETEREKGQRISQESVLLYSGIYQVARTAEQFISEAIRKLENEFPNINKEARCDEEKA